MARTMQIEVELSELLARQGVRVTRQRLEVLLELSRERDDITAQELWRRLREHDSQTGLATVYRTLALLADKGVVDTLSHHGTELCYRLCTESHHHHLVCSSCHRVVEVEQCGLGNWLDAVTAKHGFVATDHRVEITGLCEACR
ncbi:MAG: Fur family transcriptional regulator, ferric uptake regulator [Gaiellaceae bacterium]|nr:Fur family transcriptional regulator, ferric uptake regulator [Gaiellaceae bacterium]